VCFLVLGWECYSVGGGMGGTVVKYGNGMGMEKILGNGLGMGLFCSIVLLFNANRCRFPRVMRLTDEQWTVFL